MAPACRGLFSHTFPYYLASRSSRLRLPSRLISRTRSFSAATTPLTALPRSPLLEAIAQHDRDSVAITHSASGRSFTYGSLLRDVVYMRGRLWTKTRCQQSDLDGVAFLIENSYEYVVVLLAVFALNARAIPLSPNFPAAELKYILEHSNADALVTSPRYEDFGTSVLGDVAGRQLVQIPLDQEFSDDSGSIDPISFTGDQDEASGGLMLYTSGTTARPKGVLLDQQLLTAQARSLLQAWEYSPNDLLLHVLPLHHIHGTVNALIAPLLAGSTIEFMFPFNADQVWKRLAAPFHRIRKDGLGPVTFLTAVPTVWSRLLQSFPTLSPNIQKAAKEAIQRANLRLNISGSAALPVPIKQAWTNLSDGNVLLERYGMTEVGMALSCGLADEDRIDGSVGWPLPSVEVRLVESDTNGIISPGNEQDESGKERVGDIQLRGPTIFEGYWNDPEATQKEFTSDGWFKTGDVAVRRHVPGSGLGKSGNWARGPAYFILGRKSADIIKIGGEKVSALEVERELLSLPEVDECAVVALPSESWGQKVAAIVVLSEAGTTAGKGGRAWSAMDMRRALRGKLAGYKIPEELKVVEEISRNAMGKVNKKELVKGMFEDNPP